MLLRIIIVPSLHFLQGFSATSGTALLGQLTLMQTSCGRLAFLIILTIGNWQCWQIFWVTSTKPVAGSLKVVLHSGYLSHAINLPNFPVRNISIPGLQFGHLPTVVIAALVSVKVFFSSSPTIFSFDLNSAHKSVKTPLASVRISSRCFLFSRISSISS